jgi:hypothetical protein
MLIIINAAGIIGSVRKTKRLVAGRVNAAWVNFAGMLCRRLALKRLESLGIAIIVIGIKSIIPGQQGMPASH